MRDFFGAECRVHGGKRENLEQGVSDQDRVPAHMHDQKFSANMDPGVPSEQESDTVIDSGPLPVSGKFRQDSAITQDLPPGVQVSATRDPPLPAEKRISPGDIRTADYIGIERGFGTGPCDCCGYKWVAYQKRMTRERMHQPHRPNRKICRKCYNQAKAGEEDEIYTLPGILNIARMEPLFTDLGRCQVCNIGKAVWTDPEDHVQICESCYHCHAGVSALVVS